MQDLHTIRPLRRPATSLELHVHLAGGPAIRCVGIRPAREFRSIVYYRLHRTEPGVGVAVGDTLAEKLGLPLWAQRSIAPLATPLALALSPFRLLLDGLQRMREILGILIFLGVGMLLFTAVVWYISVVHQWWTSASGPASVGTVTVLGLDERQTKAVAAALPAMILAELKRVGGRTNEAKLQLRELEVAQSQQTNPGDPRFAPIPVPEGLKTEVAIPQQIAGVEIGWLLSWVKDLLAPTNVIDLTVSFDAESKKASVFGHSKGKPGYAFYVQNDTGHSDEVAQAVAAAIIQHEQRRGEIAVQPLSASDYLPVVRALSAYATYEKVKSSWKEQQGELPNFTKEYKEQLESIARIAEAHTHWAELQWLAAEIAERAGDKQRALVFTINEQLLTPRNDQRYGRLAARLQRLKETQVASDSSADKLVETRAAAGSAPEDKLVEPIRKAIDLPKPSGDPGRASARIAFIGTPWPGALGDKAKIVRTTPDQDDSFADYTTGMMQVSRIVAPNARYEFFGATPRGGGLNIEAIHSALLDIQRSSPDVLCFGFTSSPQTPQLLADLAKDVVVVAAAGNTPGESGFASIDDTILVVGATDLGGERARFSSSSNRGVWAPGVRIPQISPVTGKVTYGDGTSYSAALVAGAAALLKTAHPKARPMQIVTALRETAKAPGSGPVKIINVNAALEHLTKAMQALTAKTN